MANSWGESSLRAIAKSLGRTIKAVSTRAYLMGLRNPNQGRYTLRGISERLGWPRSSVKKAMIALGMDLPRAVRAKATNRQVRKKPNKFAFTEEMFDALSKFFADRVANSPITHVVNGAEIPYKRKSRVLAHCTRCTRRRLIIASGLCGACSVYVYRHRLSWGVGSCAPCCSLCQKTETRPHTRTVCLACNREQARNRYAQKKGKQ